MLQTIREKSQGWIATVILGFVCFTFALWGIHYYLNQSPGVSIVAKVNGEQIGENALNEALSTLQQQTKSAMSAAYRQDGDFQNQLRNQALTNLINNKILLQSLKKMGFYIGQAQLQQFLLHVPAFQVNGQFSEARFEQFLSAMSYSPEQFIAKLNNELIINQFTAGIVSSNFALPNEVNNAIQFLRQTRDIGYIVLDPETVGSVTPITENEMRAYYNSHHQQFTTPAKVSLEYVLLSAEALQKEQHLSKEASEKQFASSGETLANISYENPNSLIPVSEALHLPIQTTASFFQGQKGEGILANPTVLHTAFMDDVYKEGYNSDVIELSPSAQLVIRVKDKTPPTLMPFNEVQDEIKKRLMTEQQLKSTQQMAQKIVNDLSQGQSGEDVAKTYGLAWHERADINRELNNFDPKVLSQLFDMQKPAERQHPTTAIIALPSGKIAAVALYDIKLGDPKLASMQEKESFLTVIAEKHGEVDYQLMVAALRKQAKVREY